MKRHKRNFSLTLNPKTAEEVTYAIKNLKDRKAVGPDKIPVDALKLIRDDKISIKVNLHNTISTTGILPKKECSDFKTITLKSHTLKTFLKIIHRRIYI